MMSRRHFMVGLLCQGARPVHAVKYLATKPRRRCVPKRVRQLVWYKYIGKAIGAAPCTCCRITEISQMDFECGHIVSVKDGGDDKVPNLRPICSSCNQSMSARNMRAFAADCGFPPIGK